MLTKLQVFYNHSTRQVLGFQNPCYLKKAQQLKPKLYDGCVIEKSEAIVVPDIVETLMLAEESHSKMIEKQNDPQMIDKKVITKPINYAILNQLSTDFKTRFVPHTESSAKQAFWSQYSVQTDEPNLSGTTIVEVPKELPKVGMVNSCLKKLKFHLANFDMVVKERTTVTAITEGTWGFEHTKACFRDDIIPFVQSLKELFTSFDQWLIDEVTEVQNVFTQMELAVEQHCEEKSKVQTKMKNVLPENDRLLTQALSVEIRDTWSSQESAPTFAELFEINNLKAQAQAKDTVILKLKEKLNSLNGDVKDREVKRNVKDMETLNIELDHKVTKLATKNDHLKQTYKQLYDSIKSSRVRSKEQCDYLIKKFNLKSVKVSDLNARLQEKVLAIAALKEQLDKLKGKVILTKAELFTSFDQCLIDEVTEVQKIFKQMEMAVEQHCAEKTKFQTKIENVLKENDRLLTQALSVEIVNIGVHDCMNVNCLNEDACEHYVPTESELQTDFIKKECYEKLLQQYHSLETHCISLEVNNQLNTEIFQSDNVSSSESAPTFADLFKINELKAQIQEKDTVILKLSSLLVVMLRKER
nr:hypothetical protein [Tanacetum cinerariifolium]